MVPQHVLKRLSRWLRRVMRAGLLAGFVLLILPMPAGSAHWARLDKTETFDCSTVTDIPKIECEALVALYDSADGYHWFENGNWLGTTTVADWYGVTVSGGHVTGIDLSNNEMYGTIPAELEDLSMLKEFSVAFNDLDGGIPTWLGNMTTLEKLGLGANPLGGEIPSSLGNLVNLTDLMLFGTDVTGSIPSTLGNLDKVINMHLNDNFLSGNIPPQLGDLDSIEHLWMSANQLEGSIPTEMGNLTGIKSLLFDSNKLSGDIPESLTNLTNLCPPEDDYCPGLGLTYNHLNTTGLSQTLLDFLEENDPGWELSQAVEETIPGDTGGMLTSNDASTEITIPPDAVEGEVTFTFEPQVPMDLPNRYSNNSFELTALDSLDNPITVFDEPLIIKLSYDEEDLKGGFEQSLILYYFDEDAEMYLDVVTTCDDGVYTRNLVENWLSVPLCHLSEFHLIGQPLRNLYLPLMTK